MSRRLCCALVGLLAALGLLAGCGAKAAQTTPPVTVAPSTATPVTPSPTAAPSATPAPTVVPSATLGPPSPTVVPSATLGPPSPTVVPSATLGPPSLPPPLSPTSTMPPVASQTLALDQPAATSAYVFPVRSDGRISYAQAHHDYPATDIFCPPGSAFVAVTDGVVDFASAEDIWVPATDRPELRGGISVAIIGDDGLRYYGSHLSALEPGIAPGVRVTVGQSLGTTGNSGNARSTPPHLHFGISRPTTPDDWQTRRGQVSPYRYLKAWESGEPLTPVLP